MGNYSAANEFFLIRLSQYPELQLFLVVLCLIMYTIILLGNSLLIASAYRTLTSTSPCISSLGTSHFWTCVTHHRPFLRRLLCLCLRENPPPSLAVLCRWLSLLVWVPLSVSSWLWWPMTGMWTSATHWGIPSSWTRCYMCTWLYGLRS